MQSFDKNGTGSNVHRDIEARTSPLVTANPFVLQTLLGAHGLREAGRVLTIPMVEEAAPKEGDYAKLMMEASSTLPTLLGVGTEIANLKEEVAHWADKIGTLLNHPDTQQLKNNYGIAIALANLVGVPHLLYFLTKINENLNASY